MYLVYEQNIIRFEIGEYPCQFPGLIQHRTGGHLDVYAQFVRYDVAQGRLSQARRPVKQDMIQCLFSFLGRLNKYFEVFLYLILSGKAVERRRTQSLLVIALAL